MSSTNIHATAFKTWWVMLPMVEATQIRDTLKKELGWSSQQWFSRINGKTEFTTAEKKIISTLTNFKFN